MGTEELNYCVRNGNRCGLSVISAGMVEDVQSTLKTAQRRRGKTRDKGGTDKGQGVRDFSMWIGSEPEFEIQRACGQVLGLLVPVR